MDNKQVDRARSQERLEADSTRRFISKRMKDVELRWVKKKKVKKIQMHLSGPNSALSSV